MVNCVECTHIFLNYFSFFVVCVCVPLHTLLIVWESYNIIITVLTHTELSEDTENLCGGGDGYTVNSSVAFCLLLASSEMESNMATEWDRKREKKLNEKRLTWKKRMKNANLSAATTAILKYQI